MYAPSLWRDGSRAYLKSFARTKTGASGLALLTRRSGAKACERLRYVHHAHWAASGGSYLPGTSVVCGRVIVNLAARSARPSPHVLQHATTISTLLFSLAA